MKLNSATVFYAAMAVLWPWLLVAVVILLFGGASEASAQTAITRYVDPSCANDGDGTSASCAGAPAGAGAWNTLSTAEAQNRDLVTNNEAWTINVSGGTDSTFVDWDGWITDATRTITIVGDGTYTLTSSTYSFTLKIQDPYMTVQNFTVLKSGDSLVCRNIHVTEGNVTVERMKVGSTVTNCQESFKALIQFDTGATGEYWTARNNIVYESGGTTARGIQVNSAAGMTINVQSNTSADNGGYAFSLFGTNPDVLNLDNNIGTGSTGEGDFEVNISGVTTNNKRTNISSDATSPNASLRNITITYVDATNDDYHIDAGETDAIDAGTDLSGSFTVDFDGETRGASWDIGADEIVAAGGGGSAAKLLLILGDE